MVQYFCYFQGYWKFRKFNYRDFCRFIRDICLFTSRDMGYFVPHIQASLLWNLISGVKKLKTFISQVYNLQKLKNISLTAVTFFATETKVTCLSERVFLIFIFPSNRNFHGHVGNFIWKTYYITLRLCNKILNASSINKYARSLKFRN